MIQLAGIDLAWQSSRNGSAVAVGELTGRVLQVTTLETSLVSLKSVMQCLQSHAALHGIAIDAPLIIPNATGQRACERQLASAYGSRKASCHTSNLGLYPNADSVRLSDQLQALGFRHLAAPDQRWQMECYPHPAMIEVFDLPERLLYKKGGADQMRAGQIRLASLIRQLESAMDLSLQVPDQLSSCLDPVRIMKLKGVALKHNEDQLDALFCLYIAGMYQLGLPGRVFGDVQQGYIQVPTQKMQHSMQKDCLTGGCVCGQVRFEVQDAFHSFHLCHCSQCRKMSGTAHAANLFIEPEKFRWVQGESIVKRYDVPGRALTRAFCIECGSALPYLSRLSGQMLVPAGSLDHQASLEPQDHIFWDERAGWYDRLQALPRFSKFSGEQ